MATPEDVAGMRYAAQIPKAKPKPKPKPKATPKPTPKPATTNLSTLEGRLRPSIYQGDFGDGGAVGQFVAPAVPTDAPLTQEQFDQAIIEGNAAATAGNAALAAGNAAAIEAGYQPLSLASTSLINVKEISSDTRDAFEVMKQTLRSWGLEDLAETYGSLMATGMSPEAAMTKIKYDKTVNPATNRPWNDAYNTRFKGNELRVAKGLNAYSEGAYLDVENEYNDILTRYGLSNIIKADAAGKRAQFAGYMGNDIAPPEFAERIKNVSERVLNMDPTIKAQFQAYYPSLTHTDLVSYFLDPQETLPVLKNKITAAEIGAVAGAAKYGIGETRAMDLAKFGVTRTQALTGYQDIAEVTPTGMKLSNVYGEEGIQYGQTTAEDEFLKQDAQAKIKRNRLASKERASFQGSAGNISGSFKRSTAGQI